MQHAATTEFINRPVSSARGAHGFNDSILKNEKTFAQHAATTNEKNEKTCGQHAATTNDLVQFKNCFYYQILLKY